MRAAKDGHDDVPSVPLDAVRRAKPPRVKIVFVGRLRGAARVRRGVMAAATKAAASRRARQADEAKRMRADGDKWELIAARLRVSVTTARRRARSTCGSRR
jgi:hypothetical protein